MHSVVAVLGGIIGALLLVMICGGYYFYNKQRKNMDDREMDTLEMMDSSNGQTINIEADDQQLIESKVTRS